MAKKARKPKSAPLHKRFVSEMLLWFLSVSVEYTDNQTVIRLMVRAICYRFFMLRFEDKQVDCERMITSLASFCTGAINSDDLFRLVYDKPYGKSPSLKSLLDKYEYALDEGMFTEEDVEAGLVHTKVTPAFVGVVFENLLHLVTSDDKISEAKRTGSYYTPAEIVDYIVKEAVVLCLAENVYAELGGKPEIAPDDRGVMQDTPLAAGLKRILYGDGVSIFSTTDAAQILYHLYANMKTLEPSVGAGNFVIGLLRVLDQLVRTLDPSGCLLRTLIDCFEDRNVVAPVWHDLDALRRIILVYRCVYAVDILPLAAEITRMRTILWTLVPQLATAETPDDLFCVNLETRILAANTLIDPLIRLEEKSKRMVKTEMTKVETHVMTQTDLFGTEARG